MCLVRKCGTASHDHPPGESPPGSRENKEQTISSSQSHNKYLVGQGGGEKTILTEASRALSGALYFTHSHQTFFSTCH